METLRVVYEWIREFADIHLFTLGGTDFTVWTLIYLIALVTLLLYLSKRIKRWLIESIPFHSVISIYDPAWVGSLILHSNAVTTHSERRNSLMIAAGAFHDC